MMMTVRWTLSTTAYQTPLNTGWYRVHNQNLVKMKRRTEDRMPSYVTAIKADAQWCEPDPCGGQCTTGCTAAVWTLWGMRFSIKQKLKWRGSRRGELAVCTHTYAQQTHTHRDHRKILMGCLGRLKEKWTTLQVCGGTTGECQAWTKEKKNLSASRQNISSTASTGWVPSGPTIHFLSLSNQLVDRHQLSTVNLTSMTFHVVFFFMSLKKNEYTVLLCFMVFNSNKTKHHFTFV